MLWSLETVSVLVTLAVAAFASISVYVFLISRVLPDLLLKPLYDDSRDGDRGLRRYTFEGGRAILYEPSAPYRKYLKQYILSANGNEKYIKCKFSDRVNAVRYEVIAFDSNDRMIDTVCIEEHILKEKENISGAAMLPRQTAYVRVLLYSVNGVITDHEKLLYVPASRRWGFACIVTVGLVGITLLARALIVMLCNLLFDYSAIATGYGELFAVCSALVTGGVLSLVLDRVCCPSERKRKKRKD